MKTCLQAHRIALSKTRAIKTHHLMIHYCVCDPQRPSWSAQTLQRKKPVSTNKQRENSHFSPRNPETLFKGSSGNALVLPDAW